MKRFFGKYRGKVKGNVDPLLLGRIQVSVPAVFGSLGSGWAMPCVPYAGKGVGLFAIPPVGANVWVEFEGGDPDYPIGSGCFWGEGKLPVQPAVPEVKVFKTDGITLRFNDLDGAGGLTLEVNPPVVPTPLKMVLDADGIALTNGEASVKIQLTGVSLSHTTASISLQPSAFSLQPSAFSLQPSAFSLQPAELSVANGVAGVKLQPTGISVENSAASITLTPISVSVNHGALEVI
jgi:hypothetical protein